MSLDEFAEALGPALTGALTGRGFTELTSVQRAVLESDAAGRNLRISSQTGSGKTVALGLVVRDVVIASAGEKCGNTPKPRVVVIEPTRELAKQVEEELGWLFAPVSARVVAVTGGSNPRDERRNLARGANIVVGTPGRLLDHLDRGGIDPTEVGAVVLDEADRMLDMGFREDIEAILGKLPAGRATHLVSATFPREVEALARRVQREPLRIEGTRHGEANADIDHVVALVDPEERFDAIVNLLLLDPTERTLVFARTRADVASLAEQLDEAGFSARPISGDLEQPERLRVLRAFKRGNLRILVATDVAARGLDVQGITRVIHADPPSDPDSYTHRSGRTGRAGKKGTSVVVAIPAELGLVNRVLRRAAITFRVEPAPTPEAIRAAADARLLAELTGPDAETPPEGAVVLARKIAAVESPEVAIARLLVRVEGSAAPPPRDVRVIEPPTMRAPAARGRETFRDRDGGRGRYGRDRDGYRDGPPQGGYRDGPPQGGYRDGPSPAQGGFRDEPRQSVAPVVPPPRPSAPGETFAERIADSPRARPERARRPDDAPRPVWGDRSNRPEQGDRRDRADRPRMLPSETHAGAGAVFVPFRVTWGSAHGADPRRLLALVCRRGGIRGSDVGAIHVGESTSIVEVAESVGTQFAELASQPDPRDPRVRIKPERDAAPPPRDRVSSPRDRAPAPRDVAPPPPRDRAPAPRDVAPPPPRDRAHAPRDRVAPKPRPVAPAAERPREAVRAPKPPGRRIVQTPVAAERPVRRRTPR